jgi:hypothetical protein
MYVVNYKLLIANFYKSHRSFYKFRVEFEQYILVASKLNSYHTKVTHYE